MGWNKKKKGRQTWSTPRKSCVFWVVTLWPVEHLGGSACLHQYWSICWISCTLACSCFLFPKTSHDIVAGAPAAFRGDTSGAFCSKIMILALNLNYIYKVLSFMPSERFAELLMLMFNKAVAMATGTSQMFCGGLSKAHTFLNMLFWTFQRLNIWKRQYIFQISSSQFALLIMHSHKRMKNTYYLRQCGGANLRNIKKIKVKLITLENEA